MGENISINSNKASYDQAPRLAELSLADSEITEQRRNAIEGSYPDYDLFQRNNEGNIAKIGNNDFYEKYQNRHRTNEIAGDVVGGVAGYSAATSALSGAVAIGLVSGPAGWVVIAVGVTGAMVVGYVGGKIAKQIGKMTDDSKMHVEPILNPDGSVQGLKLKKYIDNSHVDEGMTTTIMLDQSGKLRVGQSDLVQAKTTIIPNTRDTKNMHEIFRQSDKLAQQDLIKSPGLSIDLYDLEGNKTQTLTIPVNDPSYDLITSTMIADFMQDPDYSAANNLAFLAVNQLNRFDSELSAADTQNQPEGATALDQKQAVYKSILDIYDDALYKMKSNLREKHGNNFPLPQHVEALEHAINSGKEYLELREDLYGNATRDLWLTLSNLENPNLVAASGTSPRANFAIRDFLDQEQKQGNLLNIDFDLNTRTGRLNSNPSLEGIQRLEKILSNKRTEELKSLYKKNFINRPSSSSARMASSNIKRTAVDKFNLELLDLDGNHIIDEQEFEQSLKKDQLERRAYRLNNDNLTKINNLIKRYSMKLEKKSQKDRQKLFALSKLSESINNDPRNIFLFDLNSPEEINEDSYYTKYLWTKHFAGDTESKAKARKVSGFNNPSDIAKALREAFIEVLEYEKESPFKSKIIDFIDE